jgi:hypothetical protein
VFYCAHDRSVVNTQLVKEALKCGFYINILVLLLLAVMNPQVLTL